MKNLIVAALAIGAVLLVWLVLTLGLPDSDPRSIGHYVPVFWGGFFGFLVMIKTDDWRWHLGGAIAGALIGLAYVVFH